jgi:hypothetical protein
MLDGVKFRYSDVVKKLRALLGFLLCLVLEYITGVFRGFCNNVAEDLSFV